MLTMSLRRYVERPGNVCIDGPQDHEQRRRLQEASAAATHGGNQCWVQLSHAGRQNSVEVNKVGCGPSPIKNKVCAPVHVHACVQEGIVGLQRSAAARVCQRHGGLQRSVQRSRSGRDDKEDIDRGLLLSAFLENVLFRNDNVSIDDALSAAGIS